MRRCTSSSSRCMSTAAASSRLLRPNRAQLGRFPRLGSRTPAGVREHARISHRDDHIESADPDGGVRGAPVCEDRGPRGRPWRPAAGTGEARTRRRRRDAALSRASPPGPRSVRSACHSAGRSMMADVSAVIERRRPHVFIDHAGYFDRDYLYGASAHDYPDNPERFAFSGQAALDVGRIDRAQLRRRPRARLAGRARAGACCSGPFRHGARPRRPATRLHDPQPRVSGRLRRELAAAARLGLGSDARGRAGVLGPHQLPQGAASCSAG